MSQPSANNSSARSPSAARVVVATFSPARADRSLAIQRHSVTSKSFYHTVVAAFVRPCGSVIMEGRTELGHAGIIRLKAESRWKPKK